MSKNLLIVTQKIDADDSVLGFFHGWVEELAKTVPLLTVICLEEGSHELPANVRVFSLGKESGGRTRWQYISTFYKYIWNMRQDYDTVFVHMNQEYALLGGLVWRVLGKRVLFWRNHRRGNWLTRTAVTFSHTVFCTSPHSYTARMTKSRLMPAGIDTELFKPVAGARVKRLVLCAGRISPNKRQHVLVEAVDTLWTEGEKLRVSFVGDASRGSEEYYEKVRAAASLLEHEAIVAFYEGVSQAHMPELYGSHEVFVNLTETGSFDKTVLEAMACGSLPLVSNLSFRSMFPSEYRELLCFKEDDSDDLAEKLSVLLGQPDSAKQKISRAMREIVAEKHSLKRLIDELMVYVNR